MQPAAVASQGGDARGRERGTRWCTRGVICARERNVANAGKKCASCVCVRYMREREKRISNSPSTLYLARLFTELLLPAYRSPSSIALSP